jgi:hypothetical protein
MIWGQCSDFGNSFAEKIEENDGNFTSKYFYFMPKIDHNNRCFLNYNCTVQTLSLWLNDISFRYPGIGYLKALSEQA